MQDISLLREGAISWSLADCSGLLDYHRMQQKYVLELPKLEHKKLCSFHLDLLEHSLLEYLLWGKLAAMQEAKLLWVCHVMRSPQCMGWPWMMRHHVERERNQGTRGTIDVDWEAILEVDRQPQLLAPADATWMRDEPLAKLFHIPYQQNYNWKWLD